MQHEYRLKLYRGNWAVVWSENGSTRRSSLGTPDREKAEIAFDIWLSQVTGPKRPDLVTTGKILDGYFAAKPKVFPRPSLLAFFRSRLPENITEQVCAEYRDMRGKVVAQATIWTELTMLRTALIWATTQQPPWIDRAPTIYPGDAPPARERWITKEEGNALAAACRSPHMKLFVELAMATCARSGAILGLIWNRVNDKFIDFRDPTMAETNKRRAVVPIADHLRPMLEEARRGAMTNHVIEYAGQPVTSVKKAFARVAARAGLEDVSPHTLRHSGATWMAMDGVDMRRISLMLGHSLQKTTERYAKYSPDYLADAVNALSRGQLVQLNQKTGTDSE